MSLNNRQRVKVNAALALIALHGHNPRPVQKAAKESMGKGIPAPEAYTLALNAFAGRVPAMRQSLEIAIQLVGASDEATVAQYDKAITAYNQTGDESHFDAITPMIVEDAKALAIRNGDVTAEDALYWDVQAALGIDETAISAAPDMPDASTPADGSPVPSSFAFANAQPPKPDAPAQAQQHQQASMTNPGQVSLASSPTGYRPGAAQQAAPASPASDPTAAGRTATGYRPGVSGEKARQRQGTPMGDVAFVRTATGFRPAPTGEQARREAGTPIADIG